MKRKKWLCGKGLRRALALFLAVLTLWVVALTAPWDSVSAVFSSWESGADFAISVLRYELGRPNGEDGTLAGLNRWQTMVVRQSPLLLAGPPAPVETDNAVLPDDEEPTETVPQSNASADVVEQTIIPRGGSGYSHAAEVYIQNPTDAEVDVAAMAAAELPVSLGEDGPQVLIYHTHGSEAYTPDGSDVYTESSSYRTTDTNYNVVRVGDEMAKVLESYGITVLHDRSLYDYPSYNGAYGRSTQSVADYLARYPSIKVVLDVHRDALVGEDGTTYKVVTEVDGAKVAQVMMVVGTDQGGASHPNWRLNLTFAVKVQQALNASTPKLARAIAMRASRYNQQYLPGCLLVEVGSHGNTLQEAIGGGKLFAKTLAEVLKG